MRRRRRRFVVLGFFVVFFSVAPAISAAPAAEPNIGEAQADFSAGQYRSSLQKISRILSGPTAKPGSTARYDLFMLRGECLLQLKETNLADDAFDAAGRSVKGQGDVKRVAAARAMAVLITSSRQLAYTPAGKTEADAIDIVAPASRSKAMEALLEDRLAAIKPRVDEALKATTLVPMDQLLPSLRDAYLIEMAATGDAKQTLPIAKSLGQRARELIQAQLERMGNRVNELYDLAGEPTLSSGSRDLGFRGLTSPERDELRQIADELMKIKKTAQEGRRINRALGGTGETWDAILSEFDDCAERAQRAYDRRY